MKRFSPLLFALAASCGIPLLRSAHANPRAVASRPNGVAGGARVETSYGRLPLRFEENHGQTDSRYPFVVRAAGLSLRLAPDKMEFLLRPKNDSPESFHAGIKPLQLRLAGANALAKATGEDRLSGSSNYFAGSRKNWRTNIAAYRKARFSRVYPGVDLIYYGSEGRLEYDFILSPGARPETLRWRPQGTRKVSLDRGGNLLLRTDGDTVRFNRPVAYQVIGGKRKSIPAKYVLTSTGSVGFKAGKYDLRKPLVIDPVIAYSTFVGGSGYDYGTSVAVDAQGYAYVAGTAASLDFPIQPYATRSAGQYGELEDAFVYKLDPSGTRVIYCDYLGGGGKDEARGIAVDAAGNAYVAGYTESKYDPGNPALGLEGRAGFPTTSNAFDPSGHLYDAFLSKIDPDGTALLYSTFLGSGDTEEARAVAVDDRGNAYVAGMTKSAFDPTYPELFRDFPTTSGAFQTAYGGKGLLEGDGFVAKFDTNASGADSLVYSTYLGGSGGDKVNSIAVDPEGEVVVAGLTDSADFPTTPGSFQPAYIGGGGGALFGDAFVTKFNAQGTGLVFSTYLGGGNSDEAAGVALDRNGNVLLTGYTYSSELDQPFPTTGDALQGKSLDRCDDPYVSPDGSGNVIEIGDKGRLCSDAFIAKMYPNGSGLIYSTYLGGNFADVGQSIAVDAGGNAYVGGRGGSTNFPVSPSAPFLIGGGDKDGFVAEIDPNGKFLFITQTSARPEGIALDPQRNLYVTGAAYSGSYPVTADAPQTRFGGGSDVFLTKIGGLEGGTTPNESQLYAVEATGGAVRLGDESRLYVLIRAIPSDPNAPEVNCVAQVYGPDGDELTRWNETFVAGQGLLAFYDLQVPAAVGDYRIRFAFSDDEISRTFEIKADSPALAPPQLQIRAPNDGSLEAVWQPVTGAQGYYVEILEHTVTDGQDALSFIAAGPGYNDKATLPAGGLQAGHHYLALAFALTVDPRADHYPPTLSGTANLSEEFTTGYSTPPPVTPPPATGDLNGDGKVNIQDATLGLRIVVGTVVPTDEQKAAGDMNGDGKIDVRDVTLILKKAVGL
jgi:hypothetical protein